MRSLDMKVGGGPEISRDAVAGSDHARMQRDKRRRSTPKQLSIEWEWIDANPIPLSMASEIVLGISRRWALRSGTADSTSRALGGEVRDHR
jgi:hypothetical protein